jgi:hypothetical protein
MQNKIAIEEHFAIEGAKKYKNDVMDAPTFAEVNIASNRSDGQGRY